MATTTIEEKRLFDVLNALCAELDKCRPTKEEKEANMKRVLDMFKVEEKKHEQMMSKGGLTIFVPPFLKHAMMKITLPFNVRCIVSENINAPMLMASTYPFWCDYL
jgi:hypothetical protein